LDDHCLVLLTKEETALVSTLIQSNFRIKFLTEFRTNKCILFIRRMILDLNFDPAEDDVQHGKEDAQHGKRIEKEYGELSV
jgi:hypothetical protein